MAEATDSLTAVLTELRVTAPVRGHVEGNPPQPTAQAALTHPVTRPAARPHAGVAGHQKGKP